MAEQHDPAPASTNNAITEVDGVKQTVTQTKLYPEQQTSYQRMIQNLDWKNSKLGPIETWPPTLKNAAQLMLSSPGPCAIFWGPERLMIYNEAHVPIMESYHPWILGRSILNDFAPWREYQYEDLCRQVDTTQKSVSILAQAGPLLERDGVLRETFFTLSYMPLFGDDGTVHGIYDQVTDVTKEVLSQGRMSSLLRVSSIASTAKTQADLWTNTLQVLESCKGDVPLATIFSIDENMPLRPSKNPEEQLGVCRTWVSKGSMGWPENHPATARVLDLEKTRGFEPAIHQAMKGSGPMVFSTGDDALPNTLLVGCEHKGKPCTNIVVYPLRLSSGAVVGCIILGLNPLRAYDEDYQHFVEVMARQIEDALKLVVFLEAQAKLLQDTVKQAEHEQEVLAKQLEQSHREARESELRFLNFAKQAPVSVFVLNADGSVQFCNDTWLEVQGITREMLNNDNNKLLWRPSVHPDDLGDVDRRWQLLSEGKSQELFEWRVIRTVTDARGRQGDIVYLRSSCYAELDGDGKMKAVTGISIDYSQEMANREATTARMEAALEEKRAQEYFMDMVSHEMRNPLNAMIQCAEEASDMLMDLQIHQGQQASSSNTIHDCAESMSTILYCGRHQKQLIDDVLTLSKLDSNLLTISLVPACPAGLVRQVFKMFDSDMRATDVKLSVAPNSRDLLGETEDTVLLDPGRTLQILINLIGNAVKFMKGRQNKELHVSVRASLSRDPTPGIKYISSGRTREDPTKTFSEKTPGEVVYVYFSVRDTGPGLTEAEMDALFARFRQSSPRTHAQYGGSGLGLFISRELTELHGGEIGVASKVDQGSTFAFYIKGRCSTRSAQHPKSSTSPTTRHVILPRELVEGKDAPERTTPDVKAPQPLLTGLGVMIVEDNVINQQVLGRQLRKLGLDVTTANHGEEALAILKTSTWWQDNTEGNHDAELRKQLHIILCDLEMPVMDGRTCVARIRQWQKDGSLHSHIPVLAVTGNARAHLNEALEWGFDHVVSKPFSVKSLVPLIESHVEKGRGREANGVAS